MKLNTIGYDVKEYMTLIPFGDIHYGGRECNEKVFHAHLNMIKEIPNCAVILMGDMVNCGTRDSVGAGTYDDKMTPEQQYENMIEFLTPIRDKIIGCHQGNHEERIRNTTSFDVSKMLSRELKIPYLQYGALHKIRVNDVNFHVHSIHGASGALTAGGKLNACRKMQEHVNADIYLMGHTHGLDHSTQICYQINNRKRTIEQIVRHFILTGSFVEYNRSYGERKNYSPSPIGVPKIKLYGELSRGMKKVEVSFTDK